MEILVRTVVFLTRFLHCFHQGQIREACLTGAQRIAEGGRIRGFWSCNRGFRINMEQTIHRSDGDPMEYYHVHPAIERVDGEGRGHGDGSMMPSDHDPLH